MHEDYVKKSYETFKENNAKLSYVGAINYAAKEVREEFGLLEYRYYEHTATAFFGRELMSFLGYFDSVRFGADWEFRQRAIAFYGRGVGKVVIEKNIMTYYYIRRKGSLTLNDDIGIYEYKITGERKKYKRAHDEIFHARIKIGASPYIAFPLKKRRFPVSKRIKVEKVDMKSFKELYI